MGASILPFGTVLGSTQSLNIPPPPWTNFHLSAPNRVLHSLRFDRQFVWAMTLDARIHATIRSLSFISLACRLPPLPPMATLARPRIPRRELADVFLGILQPMSFLRASSMTVDTCSLGLTNRLLFFCSSFRSFRSFHVLLLRMLPLVIVEILRFRAVGLDGLGKSLCLAAPLT